MTRQLYYRRVIKLPAHLSPNVRYGEAQIAKGLLPTDEAIIPGVLSHSGWLQRKATWSKHEQCVGLNAEFDESGESLLFPPDVLVLAQEYADRLVGTHRNTTKYLGVDPAEGGDKTTMVVIDNLGVVDLVSKKTPNTAVITGETLATMRRYNILPENVCFDRGGGGQQHADRLKEQGFNVRSVGFGEGLSLDPKRGITQIEKKMENKRERYVYKNRRAQMYGELSLLVEPEVDKWGETLSTFAISREYSELIRQLVLMPKKYDGEGRLYMLSKNKKSDNSTEQTLIDIIGNSPDEADALVLATHAMLHQKVLTRAGAIAI